MTSPNPKGLAAYLETDPQEVAGWVDNGQLRLFAATLAYLTATARNRSPEHKVADIKGVLVPLVEQAGTEWKTWWGKVQPWVGKSQYFNPGEARYTYRLTPGTEVDDIPVERLVGKPNSGKKSSSVRVEPASTSETPEGTPQQGEDNSIITLDMAQLQEVHESELERQRKSHAADLRRLQSSHADVLNSHAATMRELRDELRRSREAHAAELQIQRASHAADTALQRENHAADMQRQVERWKREEERLNYQIKSLWASIDSRMEQSRLDARKDMLLRVGDILQRAYHPTNDPETKLKQVIAHLPLALGDGGAELLGEVGEIVAFDPTRHHPSQEVASSSLVRLIAPGVIITGGEFGDLVILKANVIPIAEGP